MKRVELYARVRHAVMIDRLSQREAARRFGIDPRTVKKMLNYSIPPGYVRTRPPVRPKLDPFIGVIERILEDDKKLLKKQRHTSKRIFERLRDDRLRRPGARGEIPRAYSASFPLSATPLFRQLSGVKRSKQRSKRLCQAKILALFLTTQ
jgi:hypothetical protein